MKYADEHTIETLVDEIKGRFASKQEVGISVIEEADYKEFVSSSNTSGADGAKYCFLKVKPNDFNKPLTIHYRLTITPAASASHSDKDLIYGIYDIELVITRSYIIYNTFCKFASTSYYPIRYSVCYYLSTEAGINADYGHLIGIYAYNGYLPTDATCKRDIKVEILHVDGGKFELAKNITTFVSRSDYNAKYHTTHSYITAVIGAYHSGDQNTTYTINYLYDAGVQKSGIGNYAISRYAIVMQKPDLTWEKIVDTSAAHSTATSKKVNTRGFLLGRVRYYNTTTVCANGANAAANSFSVKAASIDMRYSTNCGTPSDWIAGQPIFLVGTIGEDGLFYLDANKWWSNTLPNTEDGKIYMQIGTVVTSASYSSTLFVEHPCYRYINGHVVRYYQGLDDKQNIIRDLDEIRSGAAKGATALQTHQDISGKQDVISDLATIRSGASKGETSVQPSAISDMETKTHAVATYQPKGNYLTEQDISGKADRASPTFTGTPKAPTAATATSTTQLATTQFVQQEIDRRASEFSFVVGSGNFVLTEVESILSIL